MRPPFRMHEILIVLKIYHDHNETSEYDNLVQSRVENISEASKLSIQIKITIKVFT